MEILMYLAAIIGGTFQYDKPAFFAVAGGLTLCVVAFIAFFYVKDKRAKR
jgi:hypothetical protein